MAVGIGAAGVAGIAWETVAGTYVAPTKFFPIRSESLEWTQGTTMRRVIRGTVDPIGAVPGNGNVGGDIDMELLPDTLPYFLGIARGTLTKTGTTDLVYEFEPNHAATPPRTASITIVRNGEAFGYTGCVVASMNFTIDDGMAVSTFSLLGREEQDVAVPTHAFTDDGPFGAGSYVLEIPTATQIFDADQFNFSIDDSGNVETRLQDSRGPAFISYGERTASLSIERDFHNRDEYDKFKELTESSVTMRMERPDDANKYVEIVMPSAIYDSYSVNLGGVGELIRASTSYTGIHDDNIDGSYSIEVGTEEDIAALT